MPETGAAANREAINEPAVERSEAVDMARLALTVDVKWGSYDPDRVLPGDEESPEPGVPPHTGALRRAPLGAW